MTREVPVEVLASRIHQPGCRWSWTSECTDDFALHRETDEEAVELLIAQTDLAHRRGLPPQGNTNQEKPRQPSHRCPVGDQVPQFPGQRFSQQRPMPWTGELYAESTDQRTLYRLYFIEGRDTWQPPTTEIVGCGVGSKPVSETTGWNSDDQTRDIHEAMDSGVTRCENLRIRWRRWNTR